MVKCKAYSLFTIVAFCVVAAEQARQVGVFAAFLVRRVRGELPTNPILDPNREEKPDV